jgi:magnesium transporter
VTSMADNAGHLDQPALTSARKDFTALAQNLTVKQALDAIRQKGAGERIVYFYVVDEEERLVGVLPTRRLLTSPLEQPLSELMVRRVIAIPHTATILEACEYFVLHKYFAFPLVDDRRRVVGVLDVSVFADEVFDIAEREQMNELFESIGFRASQVRDASPWRAFRVRFPWLLSTIAGGTVCALLASAHEATLAKTLVLAFFLTLVLGLGESVSVQSMAVTIQGLRSVRPTLRWYLRAFGKEVATALLLGGSCGLLVGLIIWGWRGAGLPALVIGASILASLCAACLIGLSVPALLHRFRLDPKIAAGPVTLALTDVSTLLFYFNFATAFLGK